MHSAFWFMAMAAAGLFIGVVAGMLGIGGGVLVIPALMFLFGFTQQRAIGTSVGMLMPPIGVFAFIRYYRAGQVDLTAAGLLALGFAAGAFFGAKFISSGAVPAKLVQPIFASFMLYIAGGMLFRSESRVWNTLVTLLTVCLFAVVYLALRAIGKRWEKSLAVTEIYRQRMERVVAPDYEI